MARMISRLQPNDSHKSFYGKAKIIDKGNMVYLQSYDTIVASYSKRTGRVTVNGWYSATTARHINAFLARYGKRGMSKRQMMSGKNKVKYSYSTW